MSKLFDKLKDRISAFDTGQESVLLAAIEKTFSKKSPTSEAILDGELSKTVNGTQSTAVRSNPIESPTLVPELGESKSIEKPEPTVVQIKPIQIDINPTAATTGKVTEAAVSQVIPSTSNTTNIVNNNSIANAATNSSNLLTDNTKNISSTNLLTDATKNISDAINSVTKNSLIALTSTVDKSKKESEKSTSKDSSTLSSLESSILSSFNKSTDSTKIVSNSSRETADNTASDTITNNLTQVKSSKLVDSSNVKKILTPDKTLEKSVTSLSKSLPEAVNNLSNSVTSISPQTNTSSTITNEGSRIDQSTQTVINKSGENTQMKSEEQSQSQAAIAPGINNEYYLQAIYSALMSGKIKVTIGY